MTSAAGDLAALGASVEWPDAEASAVARTTSHPGSGRLADLVEWLSGAQGIHPPSPPSRPRCVVAGAVSEAVATLAASLDVGVRAMTVANGSDTAAAIAVGSGTADKEIDAGADLLIIACGVTVGAAVVVGVVTGAEPVALMSRGAAATDTTVWIERVRRLRDARRRVVGLRNDAAGLLDALDEPQLAATTGLVLGSVARRTPVVLDGAGAVVAALLAYDLASRAGRWWRIADVCPDPVHTRAAAELDQKPLLDVGLAGGDGLAGLLAVPLLRAAAGLGLTDAAR